MKSTLKSRPAAHTHAAAAGSGVHLEPSHGVQPKLVAEQGGSAAVIASAPRVALQRKQLHAAFGHAVQRQAGPEDEELLQGKFPTLQRQGLGEEELLQGKFHPVQRQAGPEEEELLQGKFDPIQRQVSEEEELLQGKFVTSETPMQFKGDPGQQENRTGMPDNLKAGIEYFSGISMDDVNVHYNSDKPAQLQAYANTQGTDIHVDSGQEKHFPHETWPVVQQEKQKMLDTAVQMTRASPMQFRMNFEESTKHLDDKSRLLPPQNYNPTYVATIDTVKRFDDMVSVKQVDNITVGLGASDPNATASYSPEKKEIYVRKSNREKYANNQEALQQTLSGETAAFAHEAEHAIDHLSGKVNYIGQTDNAKANKIRTEWRAWAIEAAVATRNQSNGQIITQNQELLIESFGSKKAFKEGYSWKRTKSYLALYLNYYELEGMKKFMTEHDDWIDEALEYYKLNLEYD